MKKTKMAIVGMVALIAIVALGSIAAATSSSDGGNEKNVTLDGITFNIPDGYKIMDNYTADNEKNATDQGSEYLFNERGYNNSEGKEFQVAVVSFMNEEDYGIVDVTAALIGDEKTVNGVDGYMSGSEKRFTLFAYVAGEGKMVLITAEDPNLFEDIIVPN